MDASTWGRKVATVAHALRLVDAAEEPIATDELALRVGVTGRHLRRLFQAELGASPAEIVRSRRLRLARILIEDTELPLTRVAFQAGFASVRRFHAAVRAAFGATPTALRSRGAVSADGICLRLGYRAPFAWEPLLDFLRARAIPGVETVTAEAWQRKLPQGAVEVRDDPARTCLVLRVEGHERMPLLTLVARVRALFDLDADPSTIDAVLARSAALRDHVNAFPGVRVPGAFDRFELLVRAVLGQQISVAAATTHAGRFAARGLFAPQALAAVDPASLGLPRRRAAALCELARRVANGDLDLARELPEVPGVGPWTAGYFAMRALGDCDAFPRGDLVLEPHAATAEPWRPWRAYAALRLWQMGTRPF